MREYFISVICCAIFCGIINSMVDTKNTSGKLLKLISGTVLTFTVLSPVAEVKLRDLSFYFDDLSLEAEAAARIGQERSTEAMAAIIMQETEAYILDKANALQENIRVQISLNAECVPCAVALTGEISTSGRLELEKIIARDLGIAKEDQMWNVS